MFGLATTTGETLACHVPKKLDAPGWAKIVDSRLGPFLKKAYPRQRIKTILLDLQGDIAEALVGRL